MSKFRPEVRALLAQDPFGEDVFPRRENLLPLSKDGRTVALETLRMYLADLTFRRPGGRDKQSKATLPPIEFKIPESRIYVEWPDDEVELELPAIALLGEAQADYDSIGLTNYVDESSYGKYSPGTVVTWMGEYVENFALEIWAETRQQRRAMLVGIEQALSPFQQMAGLRFRMPDYYDQLCCFALQSRQIMDDEDAAQVRRKAKMVIELRYNCVAAVNVEPMTPTVAIEVDVEGDDITPIELDDE
jgi:hypothetical protein